MNTVSRGIRNAFRNSVRSFSIVVILGLSIGLALAMLVARASVIKKIDDVKHSVGNTVSISPAGARGFQGGGEPLTTTQIDKVSKLEHVSKVTSNLTDRLTTENTSLKSAIDPGSLGNRGANNSGVGFSVTPQQGGTSRRFEGPSDGAPTVNRTFNLPVEATGVNDLSAASAYGGDTVSYKSGQAFVTGSSDLVAVMGTALATKNSLKVGSTFTAYGKTIKLVGIYDAGNTFANGGLILPLKTLQTLSGQANDVTSATVTVDSLDNVSATTKAIQSALGTAADVTSSEDVATQAVEPLESVKSVATFSLLGALAAGAVIILLTMVMVVRERRREIGVFKAIGASDLKIMLQFMSESVTLTVLGLVVGVIIGSVAASPLTNLLVTNSANSSSTTTASAGPGGPPGAGGPETVTTTNGNGTRANRLRFQGGVRGVSNNAIRNARDVQASVGWSIIAYGIAAAFAIALVGSAIPAFLISKVRPAEVMRAE